MDADLTLRAQAFALKDPFPMKSLGLVESWVGNLKALFESIEREQAKRGNL